MNRTLRILALVLALLLAMSSWAYAVPERAADGAADARSGMLLIGDPVAEPAETEPGEPAPTEPSEPVPTEPSEPVPTEPTEPVPTEPTEPVPTEPTEPVPTEPTEPVPTEPTEPVPTEPTEPVPTEPTEPVPTEPTEPEPTEPTEPEPTEPTEPVEKPLSEMSDEELIEKFNIPNTWAREALIFAARYQILVDRDGRGLRPTDKITRAEVAAGLMKILQTTKQADVSQFTDVRPDDWFYEDMAKAFALDIFNGYDEHTMGPNLYITREQAIIVIGRLLGVQGRGRQSIYDFPDWNRVSDWAAPGVAAMIANDYIHGDETGINPLGNLSRQEFAQVMANLLDRVSSAETGACAGSLALAADSVEPGLSVDGSLLLSNDMSSMTVENLTVTGRMALQGNGQIVLTLRGCTIHELVLCRNAVVTLENCSVDKLTVNAGATVKLLSSVPTVDVYGLFVLANTGTAGVINMVADGSSMTVSGQAHAVNVLGKDVYINGSGHIDTLVVRNSGLINRCDTGETVENVDPGMGGVSFTRTDGCSVSEEAPSLTMGLKLTDMPAGKQDATVTWYVQNAAIQSSRMLIREGSVLTASFDFASLLATNPTVPIRVVISTKEAGSCRYDGYVICNVSVATLASQIRTQNVQAVVDRTTGLYRSYNLSTDTYSGLIMELTAGMQVTVLEVRDLKAARVRLEDGTEGWMDTYHKNTIQVNYWVTTDYPTEVKEYYVNKVRKCTSSTNYLIWVSLWTQRVNIFKGSKGNWKLIRTGRISSGGNYNPTPVEVTRLLYHSPKWTYDDFYVHHVTVFDTYRGFHSILIKYEEDGGGIYDGTLGRPVSHGCIRVSEEDAIFIYNLPCDHRDSSGNFHYGTAVYIY